VTKVLKEMLVIVVLPVPLVLREKKVILEIKDKKVLRV
jgi:hypothetical protein